MSIVGAFVLPHPPLAVPGVSDRDRLGIAATLDGYAAVAKRIAQLAPQTIVVISPHAIMYSDYIHISSGKGVKGDLSRFYTPEVKFDETYDTEFVEQLELLAQKRGLSAGTKGQRGRALDHGTMVPLWFVEQEYRDFQLVRCGLSGLPLIDHYLFGQCIAKVADDLQRRTVVIGSGDLAHCLRPDGPYGYNPAAPEFDKRVVEDLGRGQFGNLLEYDADFCEQAGECGHRSFIEMAGALDSRQVSVQVLSHEGPYGVGYATAIVEVGGPDPTRDFGQQYLRKQRQKVAGARAGEDAFVQLARLSVEAYVTSRTWLHVGDPQVQDLLAANPQAAQELLDTRAGAFVSIHEHGDLRGCIGTIAACADSLAQEILDNAVSACARDPRFSPIQAHELPYLDINVDVLGQAEPIDSIDQLDVKRYGVIVSNQDRRGLLLPDLDGVDTPQQQVDIARRKGGIGKFESYQLERFEVVRHT